MKPERSEAAESPKGPSARTVAARVVQRVIEEQAFVSEALDAELGRARLEERDRGLATELSYGVVRLERALSERLEKLAARGVAKGDVLSKSHLLVAAYQLLVLDRVPAFAAIDEAVEALRRLRGPKVAGFGNAILRRLARERESEPLSIGAALEKSVEPWLFEEMSRSVGAEAARSLLGAVDAGDTRRGLSVRLTARGAAAFAKERPGWAESAERSALSPAALFLPPSGDLRHLAGHAEGHFVVQEEGAQWAALALGARPGERVLDACAGHGQKAALLAERIGPEGTLWVNDVAANKIERLRREFDRLGLPAPRAHNVDLTAGVGDLPGGMDRVLVDAPCTGSGTLRRRPEILRRLKPEDPARLADQSVRLLANATALARPGGRVLFVVCSVLRTECEDVAERVRGLLAPAPFDAPEAEHVAGPGQWQYRLLPSLHGTDGYYVASFVREH
jgi:16S rRNA (cytosine967-C5)-methyltransferase